MLNKQTNNKQGKGVGVNGNFIPARKGEPSRNPNGRPKKSATYSDTLRDLLTANNISVNFTYTDSNGKERKKAFQVTADKNMYYGIAAAQIMEALKGNVNSAREIIDRIQGKANQPIDMTGDIIYQISEDYKPKPNDRNKKPE